jgi:hypothetical protein
MTVLEPPHGRSRYRHHGCRCEVCVESNRLYMRGLRARKRVLRPVPAVPTDANATPGPVVAAVQAELDGLGDLTGSQGLAAAAIAMARILDSDGNIPTWPSAARQLSSLLDTLHKSAAPKRGRLAAVQKMSPSSRPDAGA